MSEAINVGVVGYGLSAKVFHIPFIKLTPPLTLKAIVQRTPAPGNSAPADHPNISHYTTAEALFADSSIHLVVITTPPQTHFTLCKAAIAAGKHILCEKPFVPTSAEAEELVSLAKAKGVLLNVYQNRRWDADFITVQSLIEAGSFGRVTEFETHFDRHRPAPPTAASWKSKPDISTGNAPVYDLGSHLLDQVYALFGTPSRLFATHVAQRTGSFSVDEADGIIAQLFYDQTGLTVFVRISVVSPETKQPRFWVRGTKGSFVKKGLDTQEPQLRAGMAFDDPTLGKEDADMWGVLTTGEDGAFKEETITPNVVTYKVLFQKLAAAIQSGKWEDLPVPATEAVEVLKIIEGVIKSSREGVMVRF